MGLREQGERKATDKYFTKISLKYAMTLTYKLCSKSHSILYPRVICGWNWSLTVCIIFQTSDIRHTSTYIVIWLHRPKKKRNNCTAPNPARGLSLIHYCHRATHNLWLELSSFFNLTRIQEISGYFCYFYSFGSIFPFFHCAIINLKSVWLWASNCTCTKYPKNYNKWNL